MEVLVSEKNYRDPPGDGWKGPTVNSSKRARGERAARPLDVAYRAISAARRTVRPVAVGAGRPIAHGLAGKPPKRLSAMFRVKNEEEFLEAAISSVIDLVDQVVLVDNLSEDATPRIIADFARRHPDKVVAHEYPHRLARSGEENRALAATRSGRRSPSLLANFYNWCLARCSEPYILKWDGDTVASDALAPALEKFVASPIQVLWHTGVNLHESRDHFISGRPFEDMEPRLFYRRFARYGNSLGFAETLWSPYMMMYPELSERVEEPLYFHLKFCKADRFSNISDDSRVSEERNSAMGDPLPVDLRAQVERLGL